MHMILTMGHQAFPVGLDRTDDARLAEPGMSPQAYDVVQMFKEKVRILSIHVALTLLQARGFICFARGTCKKFNSHKVPLYMCD